MVSKPHKQNQIKKGREAPCHVTCSYFTPSFLYASPAGIPLSTPMKLNLRIHTNRFKAKTTKQNKETLEKAHPFLLLSSSFDPKKGNFFAEDSLFSPLQTRNRKDYCSKIGFFYWFLSLLDSILDDLSAMHCFLIYVLM